MKQLWAVVVAVVLAACAIGHAYSGEPTPVWDRTPDDAGWWRRITDYRPYVSMDDLPDGFRRPTDPFFGPAYVLFADDGTACLVDDTTFTMVSRGQEFRCVWRRWR